MSRDRALKRLGYTEEWLSCGIISEEYLLAQYKEIASSEDKNAEHYRAGGFCHFLNARDSLADEEVAAIFKLKDCGPDKCDLHENRIIELIHSNILSDGQFDHISKFPEVLQRPIQKRYLREKLIRKIESSSVSDCFEEVATCEDGAIQEYILRRKDLMTSHVRWLAEFGINKKLRNVAKQLLNSKRYRKNKTKEA